ncbi:MAG: hypothetical protein WCD20_17670 [Rhodomicrobium sp.]
MDQIRGVFVPQQRIFWICCSAASDVYARADGLGDFGSLLVAPWMTPAGSAFSIRTDVVDDCIVMIGTGAVRHAIHLQAAAVRKRRLPAILLGALGLLGLPLTVAFFGAVRERMRRQRAGLRSEQRKKQADYRRELGSYIWGYALALALTITPFALVHWSVIARHWLLIALFMAGGTIWILGNLAARMH